MHGIVILLVEDDDGIQEVLRALFLEEGYQPFVAADGEQALHLARQCHPDLILMDLTLPKLDGTEAARILKQDPGTRDIPILAMSARPEIGAIRGDWPFDGVLGKPFDLDTVLALVADHIGRRPPWPEHESSPGSGPGLP